MMLGRKVLPLLDSGKRRPALGPHVSENLHTWECLSQNFLISCQVPGPAGVGSALDLVSLSPDRMPQVWYL